MPLDPEAAAFLKQVSRQKSHPIESVPLEMSRRAASLGIGVDPNPPTLSKIENLAIPRSDGTELPIRVYVPVGTGPFAVCLYFHGGGWVLNNVDTHDALVRRLAAEAGCAFVSVEYRLAPEHKFPAAIEDAYTALTWVHANANHLGCDSERIAVAGDSAGANLAAVCCLMARDRQGPRIAFQVLVYPITDCDFERPSYNDNAEGFFLTRREMIWFWNQYVSTPDQMTEPYASPLRGLLHELPATFILTAEYDPLRDEGEAYADALRRAGVEVTLSRYDGMIHAFVRRVHQFEAARKAIKQVAGHLQAIFKNNE